MTENDRAGFRRMQYFLREIGQGPRAGRDLNREEAREALGLVLDRKVQPAQIGGFLLVERYKGESAEELLGFADALRERSSPIRPPVEALLDIGSPYDGRTKHLVVSPAASIVAVAAGAAVVMHGEKDLPPKHGIGVIDVLEALGIDVDGEVEKVEKSIAGSGFGFLRQRRVSPALYALRDIREEIALRSNLNTIEKLSNLAGAAYSVVGLTHLPYLEKMLEAAKGMGFQRVLILQGIEGNEDAPTHRPCRVFEFSDGDLREYRLDPSEFDLSPARPEDLPPGDAQTNASMLLNVLEGRDKGPRRDIVAYNAAIRLYISERADTISRGLVMAQEAIESGAARAKLEELRSRAAPKAGVA